jgi:hypothetical protein
MSTNLVCKVDVTGSSLLTLLHQFSELDAKTLAAAGTNTLVYYILSAGDSDQRSSLRMYLHIGCQGTTTTTKRNMIISFATAIPIFGVLS